MIKMEIADHNEVKELMDAEAYKAHTD